VDVIPYDPEWLPQLAALARVHGRLAPPGIALEDDEVARGLTQHAYWPFYSPGLSRGQVLLAVEEGELLAACQVGFAGHGWGYGAAAGDGPDWLYDVHLCLFWLFAWPAWRRSLEAAAALAANVVKAARSQGLPGLEAFRGGPGFLPFGTQLSSHWPHLREPLRAAGFRQPRDLVVYSGATEPESLPLPSSEARRLEFHGRRGRLEAWLDGQPAGVCVATSLSNGWTGEERYGDPRAGQWAIIRRLFVVEEARGLGIGTALLAEQLRRLHSRGKERYLLHLPESPDDLAAHVLYARFGAIIDRQQVLRLSF
jgi:GNAT superfamily N-acetyltransferase